MHSSAERSASFYEEYIMRNNKLLISALLLAAGTSLFPAVSMAQPGYCDGMGPMKEGRQGAYQDRMKQRQAQLHQELKLNPDQEKAWEQFQASHPFMGNKMQRPDRATMEKLTTPERADKMLEMSRQHQEAMSKHVSAMKTFYDTLSPEQKATFDKHSMMRAQRGDRPARKAPPAATS
jgi:periplasmic protein CpxP/Spy